MAMYSVIAETHAGKIVTLRSGFVSRQRAENHPIKLSAWKRVWVEKVIEKRAQAAAVLPPLPWGFEQSHTATANGAFHLYLTDANGRKIAALWGRSEEKLLTAERILSAVNPAGSPDG